MNKRALPEIPCDYCGKLIYRKPYRIKKDKHHFCCRLHSYLYKSKISEETFPKCAFCGKPVNRAKNKYCSVSCAFSDRWRNEWKGKRKTTDSLWITRTRRKEIFLIEVPIALSINFGIELKIIVDRLNEKVKDAKLGLIVIRHGIKHLPKQT